MRYWLKPLCRLDLWLVGNVHNFSFSFLMDSSCGHYLKSAQGFATNKSHTQPHNKHFLRSMITETRSWPWLKMFFAAQQINMMSEGQR